MIRFVLKWAFRFFLLAVVLVVFALLSLDPAMRVYLEHRIRAETGMDAEIGRVSIGVIEPRLEIRDLKLFNPPAYGGTLFLNIPEFHVEYDRTALRDSKLHFTLIRLNLSEVDIVKNENGQTNIFALGLELPLPQKNTGGVAVPRTSAPPPPPAIEKQLSSSFPAIDVLNVSIGTLKFIDLKDPSHNRAQKIGIENCVVKNVKGPADLAALTMLIAVRSGDFFESLLDPKGASNASGLWNLLR